jgi:ribosomal protein S18 acetylase RimI-like enzyme
MLEILPVNSPQQLEEVRKLFIEYEKSIGVSLCFQNFEQEVRQLPGEYTEPDGMLVIALDDGKPAGCCALRRKDKTPYAMVAEMKRLYVRPEFRGRGIARQLASEVVKTAVGKGYQSIILDTLKTMTEAQALYVTMGFVDIPSYYENPMQGTRYMLLDLRVAGPVKK